jgi:hypothetical protein
MMDIFFQDPTAIPLPPKEVRIKEFQVKLRPDNRRVHVYLEITPFQKRPNGEITIYNPQGQDVASVSIIESIVPKMELTMHLRGEIAPGLYSIQVIIYYPEAPIQSEGEYNVSQQRIIVDQTSQLLDISYDLT